MAGTSGLCSDANGVAQLVIAWLNAGGTAPTVTATLKIAFLSAVRTANNGSDTEWATAAGYTATAGGAVGGIPMPAMNAATTNTTGASQTNSAAATLTNAPAQTWAGNRIQDATVTTNKNIWYGALSGGSKTINLGDSCTLPSTTGIVTSLG